MKYNYTVYRSDRKTVAIQIKNGSLIVRAPRIISDKSIAEFVNQHSEWIEKHMSEVQKRAEELKGCQPLTENEIHELAKRAVEVIPPKVEHYAKLLGVTYGRITVRMQKTRWGSCSRSGNLNFNCLLMLAPDDVLDSVIVHELCHRKEMNHSARFYREIARVMPDYEEKRAWLSVHGDALMARGGKI